MRIIGVLLVGALMVIPVITAMQLAKNFLQTILYAIAISFISVITGLFISFYLDLASGGTIVVITLLFFFLSLIVKRKK
jgi:zinc transport system permease protein